MDARPGPSAAYTSLDEDGQVEVLRRVALGAAAGFGLEVAGLALVLHAYNTTFRVHTTDGRRLALRVNTNSQSTPQHIAAQQAWQHALAADTDVSVPDPLATPEGAWQVLVDCPEWGSPLQATVASWLEGDDVGQCDEQQARALGRTMATLHAHAASFALPAGAALTLFDEPLFHDGNRLLDPQGSGMPSASIEVVSAALAECGARFAEVYAGERPVVLHADLHGGNLKWHRARLAVFDFDDAGLGIPALDLAISTFYLRDGDPAPEEALREGYAQVRPLPEVTEEQFEALVAARQLLLANALVASSTASLRAESAAYLEVTVDRLRRWLATGRFTRAEGGT